MKYVVLSNHGCLIFILFYLIEMIIRHPWLLKSTNFIHPSINYFKKNSIMTNVTKNINIAVLVYCNLLFVLKLFYLGNCWRCSCCRQPTATIGILRIKLWNINTDGTGIEILFAKHLFIVCRKFIIFVTNVKILS